MDTVKVTKNQQQTSNNACSRYRTAFLQALLLILILYPGTSHAKSQLTTEQIIRKLEQQLNGKVISITPSNNNHFYQVRFLKSTAEILQLTTDSATGKIVEQKKPAAKKRKKNHIQF